MVTKAERVQVWISKEARRHLRLLAVKEDKELLEQIALCVKAYEALKQAGDIRGLTVQQILEEIGEAATKPPVIRPRTQQDEEQ